MAIDAIITNVKEDGQDLILELGPRIDKQGDKSIPGQPRLRVKNFTRKPIIGQAIWGGSDHCQTVPLAHIKDVWYYRRTMYGYLVEVERI